MTKVHSGHFTAEVHSGYFTAKVHSGHFTAKVDISQQKFTVAARILPETTVFFCFLSPSSDVSMFVPCTMQGCTVVRTALGH